MEQKIQYFFTEEEFKEFASECRGWCDKRVYFMSEEQRMLNMVSIKDAYEKLCLKTNLDKYYDKSDLFGSYIMLKSYQNGLGTIRLRFFNKYGDPTKYANSEKYIITSRGTMYKSKLRLVFGILPDGHDIKVALK